MNKFIFDNCALVKLSEENNFEERIDFMSIYTVGVCKKEFIHDYINIAKDISPEEKERDIQNRHKLWSSIPQNNIIKTNSDIQFAGHLKSAFATNIEYDIMNGRGICDAHIMAAVERYPGEYTCVTNDKKLQKALLEKRFSCINYKEFKRQSVNKAD